MSDYETSKLDDLQLFAASTVVVTKPAVDRKAEQRKGEEARQAGMAGAAENKKALLKHARTVAASLPAAKSGITADDVSEALVAQGISEHALGNAAGSLFLERSVWEFTGQRRKSTRKHAHGNELKVWRLKSGRPS
ncbi:MAG: hypothetical protein AAF394_18840 [Planctomycetota bacterium]